MARKGKDTDVTVTVKTEEEWNKLIESEVAIHLVHLVHLVHHVHLVLGLCLSVDCMLTRG